MKIDEEFYFEESNPKKVFFSCLLILFVIGLAAGAYYYLHSKDTVKLKNVTIELGDKVPTDINKYISGQNISGYKLDISKVHVNEDGFTDSVGEYSYQVTKENISKKGKVFVKDRKAPTVEVIDLTVGLNEEYIAEDFIASCEDLSEICYVSFVKNKDADLSAEEGTYDITLLIKDKYDNATNKKVKLIVNKDASLSNVKANDLEVDKLVPNDENWNQTYTYKFDKGILETADELDAKYLAISNADFSKSYEKEIVDQKILLIYNKYGYIIGLSVRLEFSDKTFAYVTKIPE